MQRLLGLLLLVGCGEIDQVRHLPDAPLPPDAGAVTDAPGAQIVFDSGFEGGIPPTLSVGSGVLTPSQGYEPLGPPGPRTFGPTFLRSPTGNVITMTLTGLPPHTKLTIGFLFAAIDSLDGTGTFPAGDYMRITLDGTQIFRESFFNADPVLQTQSYIAPPGGELARRIDLGFGGPGGFYTDSAYDMGVDPRFQNLPHTGATATIEFTLEGEGVQTLDDESWAIDDLSIIAIQ